MGKVTSTKGKTTRRPVKKAGTAARRNWLLRGLVVVLMLGAAGLAWSSLRSRPGPEGGTVAPAAARLGITLSNESGTELGQIAPDFVLPTLEGGKYALAEHAGKPRIIFFMAYWCGTCIPEARALTRLQQELGDQVSIVAIDIDPSSTPEALAQFRQAADNGTYTWAFDAGQQVVQAYQVTALDTTLVLDGEGHVVYRDAYPTAYEVLKQLLAELGL